MIKLTSDVATALKSNPASVTADICVRITSTTNPNADLAEGLVLINSTTAPYDLVVNGQTYLSDGRIVTVSPPSLSSTVDRDLYALTLTSDDITLENIDTYTGWVGCPISILAVFFVSGVQTDDIQTIYSGRISEVSASFKTQEMGESSIIIKCSSPMYNLDQRKGLYLSDSEIRSRNPSDACCSRIYDGSTGIMMKWGRR